MTQQKQTSLKTTVVPGEQRLKYHEEEAKKFIPHGKSAQFMTGTQASTCETCHGDGAKHSKTTLPGDRE